MKKIYVLWSLAIATLCANVFFACKSDDTLEDFYRRNGFTMELVKTPDFVVYSDGNVLSSTLTTKAETTRGESDDVLAYLAGSPTFVDAPTYSSYTITQVYVDSYGDSFPVAAWGNSMQTFYPSSMCRLSINGTILNGYNDTGDNKLNGFKYSSPLTNITYQTNTGQTNGDITNAYKFIEVNGTIYLCFDFKLPGSLNYAGDDDYNDWIFKIVPAGEGQGGQGGNTLKAGDIYNNGAIYVPSTNDAHADPNGNLWYQDWKRPHNVNAKVSNESELVINYFTNTVFKDMEPVNSVNWDNYWVHQVYKGTEHYKDGYNGDVWGSNQMNHLLAYSYSGKEYAHIKDFNSGDNQTTYTDDETSEIYLGTMLMKNMGTEIDDTPQFLYHNSTDSKYHNQYVIIPGSVIDPSLSAYYYVGFDFYATTPEGQEANKNMSVERNWVFNDWIVRISPAELKDSTPTPPDPPTPPTPPTPDDEEVDEVEVNLSVNDEKEADDYIATKLSIHIRSLTDVEVFIPVERDYYCDVDDMAIVLSHNLDINYQYSNPGQASIQNGYTYTYTVAGEYVKDGETFTANEEIHVFVTYEEGGIRVKTQGMTQAALDYLQYTYNDGITFEVWNYFNSEIINDALETIPVTRADLKPMFDQSTVTFTASDHPKQYVNAFAMLYEYRKVDLHVYMKDNKPYLLDVTTNAEGVVISETPTDNLLASQYWVANEDGTFKEFVGAKNEWDCIVSPSDEWTKVKTNNGKSPANYNEIYTK